MIWGYPYFMKPPHWKIYIRALWESQYTGALCGDLEFSTEFLGNLQGLWPKVRLGLAALRYLRTTHS